MDAASHARAAPLLRDAIAVDPGYATAHSWLAYWYIFHIGEGRSADPDADARAAAEASRTAMELDRNDARATALHAYVTAYLFRDHGKALVLHERALDISPNMADAWTLGSRPRASPATAPSRWSAPATGCGCRPRHQALLA